MPQKTEYDMLILMYTEASSLHKRQRERLLAAIYLSMTSTGA